MEAVSLPFFRRATSFLAIFLSQRLAASANWNASVSVGPDMHDGFQPVPSDSLVSKRPVSVRMSKCARDKKKLVLAPE